MIKIQPTTERKRKSEKLSKDEFRALKKFVTSYPTVVEAAETIGIHRNVLDLVIIKGSGSPETIQKVRQAVAA